jgi:hypothetical protein
MTICDEYTIRKSQREQERLKTTVGVTFEQIHAFREQVHQRELMDVLLPRSYAGIGPGLATGQAAMHPSLGSAPSSWPGQNDLLGYARSVRDTFEQIRAFREHVHQRELMEVFLPRSYAGIGAGLATGQAAMHPSLGSAASCWPGQNDLLGYARSVRDTFGAISGLPAGRDNLDIRRTPCAFDPVRDLERHYEARVFRLFCRLRLAHVERLFDRWERRGLLGIWEKKGADGVYFEVCRKLRARRHRILNAIARSWWSVPYMATRRRAVRHAVEAHKRGEFGSTITALLPLIDGLTRTIVDQFRTKFPESSISRESAPPRTPTIYAKQAADIYVRCKRGPGALCVYDLINDVVYRHYPFSSDRRAPSSLNRHGILHGRISNYCSEINSCRIILLLEAMCSLAAFVMKVQPPERP